MEAEFRETEAAQTATNEAEIAAWHAGEKEQLIRDTVRVQGLEQQIRNADKVTTA